jgi:hypothetical protein
MSWIFLTLLMLGVGFAVAFALCEWLVRPRQSGPDDDPSATG